LKESEKATVLPYTTLRACW